MTIPNEFQHLITNVRVGGSFCAFVLADRRGVIGRDTFEIVTLDNFGVDAIVCGYGHTFIMNIPAHASWRNKYFTNTKIWQLADIRVYFK